MQGYDPFDMYAFTMVHLGASRLQLFMGEEDGDSRQQ